jgi:hypothetical protein
MRVPLEAEHSRASHITSRCVSFCVFVIALSLSRTMTCC